MAVVPSPASNPGDIVRLDATGKLPPVDASQVTNLPSTSGVGAHMLLGDGAEGEPGLPGPPGIAGVAGTDGTTGQQGPAGPALFLLNEGEDGDTGPPGVPGPAGASGAPGTTGQQGPAGPALFLLSEGEDGDQGPPGQAGVAGPTGSPGTTGAQGPAGPALFLLDEAVDGDVGPPGQPGAAGTPGTTGAQGPAGPALFLLNDPDAGNDGNPGPAGAAGAAGAAGTVCYALVWNIDGPVYKGSTVRYLRNGDGLYCSLAGVRIEPAKTLTRVTVTVDVADATRSFDIEVLSDPSNATPTVLATLNLPTSATSAAGTFSVAVSASTKLGVRINRISGTAADSTFKRVNVLVVLE